MNSIIAEGLLNHAGEVANILNSKPSGQIKKYRVIQFSHYIQIVGFSVGVVTIVASYILQQQQIAIASSVLTVTTGVALVGMKDLPYLKSIQENAEMSAKRVQQVNAHIESIKKIISDSQKSSRQLDEVKNQFVRTTQQASSSRKEQITNLRRSLEELAKVTEQLEKEQTENRKMGFLLLQTKQELEKTRTELKQLKTEGNKLSNNTKSITEATEKAESSLERLKRENTQLKLSLNRDEELLKEADKQTVQLSKILKTSHELAPALQRISDNEQKTQKIINESSERIKTPQNIISDATSALAEFNQVLSSKNKKKRQKQWIN